MAGAHVGVIGVSPEGASRFLRRLARHVESTLPPALHPVVSTHAFPFPSYLNAIERDDWAGVADLLSRSARAVAQAGAAFCLTPDNGIQHGVHLAAAHSPIPWLSLVDLVASQVERDGRTHVGIIGTRFVTSGSAYQTTLGLRGIRASSPQPDDADAIDRIIFDELAHGFVSPESKARVESVISRFAEMGCGGVIVACSEAELLLDGAAPPIAAYDTSDLLAAGAVRQFVPDAPGG